MDSLSPPPLPPAAPVNFRPSPFSLSSKVSPSVLLIIIILAIIFFISGLLHLLIRFFLRPATRDPDESNNVTALQGQLQQLFHLHDAGVDQSFIDTLPVFNYKAIIGSKKDPFDCAVCLCEFEPEDKLRLLPKCSHAFHTECIDTWLLSHSTCPLCRSSLLADFSTPATCSPIVLVLESGSESSREIVSERDSNLGGASLVGGANPHPGLHCREEIGSTRMEFGSSRVEISGKSCEIPAKADGNGEKMMGEEKIVPVKLGKFRKVDESGEGSSTSSNNFDARRCLSMGSFAYVMDENLDLQVPIRTPVKKQSSKKRSGQRLAMSECDCDSRREFNMFDPFKSNVVDVSEIESWTSIGGSKRDSFSISKIWMRGKEKKSNPTPMESSRRAFSFRFPVNRNVAAGEDTKAKETGAGSELGCDEENPSRISLDSQPKTPSFARTLLWLVGRQNKVVHSSSSPNV